MSERATLSYDHCEFSVDTVSVTVTNTMIEAKKAAKM